MLTRSIRDSETSIDFVQGPPGSRRELVKGTRETYLSVGPTLGNRRGTMHVTHRKVLAQSISIGGLIGGNFDEVRSTFGLIAVSAFVVAIRTRASGLMNMHIFQFNKTFISKSFQ